MMATLRLSSDDDDPIQSGYQFRLKASVSSSFMLCLLMLLIGSLYQIVRLTIEFLSWTAAALMATFQSLLP